MVLYLQKPLWDMYWLYCNIHALVLLFAGWGCGRSHPNKAVHIRCSMQQQICRTCRTQSYACNPLETIIHPSKRSKQLHAAEPLVPGRPAARPLATQANNPSEATIAKRRSYASTISYLTPPAENAGLYKARGTGWRFWGREKGG